MPGLSSVIVSTGNHVTSPTAIRELIRQFSPLSRATCEQAIRAPPARARRGPEPEPQMARRAALDTSVKQANPSRTLA